MNRYLAVVLMLAATLAAAQPFPTRPVTLLVTFPAGGTLGAAALVNARPDGYLVSMIPSTVFRTPHMENVAFDPLKDIRYVMGVSGYVFAVAVRADAPWKTFGELAAYVKANPEKVSYGSHGIGSTVHVIMEELSAAQGWKLTHVPYTGSADMMTSLLGGHINVALDSTGAAPHVAGGKARVLAVYTEARAAVWPEWERKALARLGLARKP